jgi:ATP-dependent exoDNAse (exonuclease V) beta subunit
MDQHQRHKALNPCQSFIVQAPAGSGKTELLTQRFLALLAKVSQPEEILALTFTRKAAQEMRHRILVALQEAQAKTPLHSSHQQLTRALALEALHRDKELDWHILNHPQRLKITTFDAYCLELYQSIPNSEQLTLSKLSDYPDWCYRQAIQNWFNWCKEHPSLQQHLKKLLRTVHNQPQKLFEELNTLLACRDQWLENLHLQAQKDETEHLMTLKTIILKHWQPWENALPKNLQEELVELIQSCLNYISEDDFPHLRTWHQFTHINTSQIQELAQILLTKDLEFRKVLNHHIGLTLDRGPKTKIKELQNTSQELLATLVEYSEFHQLLIQLPQFPDPNEVFLDWELLQAYYQLLPLLVAHLHLEFEAQTCSDFIYIAQQAQLALVDTDVSLYL